MFNPIIAFVTTEAPSPHRPQEYDLLWVVWWTQWKLMSYAALEGVADHSPLRPMRDLADQTLERYGHHLNQRPGMQQRLHHFPLSVATI
jgi:hypothetical protein